MQPLCYPDTGLLLTSKISPTDKVGQTRQPQGLDLDIGSSLSTQTDTEMVVNMAGNSLLLDTQLFPSCSEEKARGRMEYARGDIWPEGHQLDCARLEHPEGYPRLHSEKAKLRCVV